MSATMKQKYLKYLLVLLVIFLTSKIQAQQDPQFTHYMYNMSVINPAYATDNANVINLGGLYRAQWVGIKAHQQLKVSSPTNRCQKE